MFVWHAADTCNTGDSVSSYTIFFVLYLKARIAHTVMHAYRTTMEHGDLINTIRYDTVQYTRLPNEPLLSALMWCVLV